MKNILNGWLKGMDQPDRRWALIWLTGLVLLWVWNVRYLNAPALRKITAGFGNTMLIAFLSVALSFLTAWGIINLLHHLYKEERRPVYLIVVFLLNLLRSVPQVIGVLLGYVGIALLLEKSIITLSWSIVLLLAAIVSVFIFLELVDLMRERIEFYRKLDFYNAMIVCGIAERRIINFDILWKNSRTHILNKLIALFGAAIFLQCSVDFIISVGLSTDVAAVNLPATLGSLLAKLDSKQDILAVGYALFHPTYLPELFFTHLQGITIAFLIVFTLLCVYKITNGLAERYHL